MEVSPLGQKRLGLHDGFYPGHRMVGDGMVNLIHLHQPQEVLSRQGPKGELGAKVSRVIASQQFSLLMTDVEVL
jgi:hypothetical protein